MVKPPLSKAGLRRSLHTRGTLLFAFAGAIALTCACDSGSAADLTVKQVVGRLRDAPADLSGLDLSFLDFSDLDFKGASLAGTDLYGSDFSNADLSHVNLSGARLDRTVIIGTDFTAANLSNASLLRPAAFSSFEIKPEEAPIFVGANLTGAHLFGRFSGVDWSGANLAFVRLGADRSAQLMLRTLSRTELVNCNFSGANLAGAELAGANLTFADLTQADLSAAVLTGADLSRADLTGAKLAGADLTGADLDGTILRGVKGLQQAVGLDQARNRERAIEE